jgi:cell division inhibitor SulA/protein ImuA
MALAPRPSAAPISSLTAHPLLWRGKQVSHHIATLGTGYAALDKALPGHGWPRGAITELVTDTLACGELSLLLPALARLSQAKQWISMIDPPWIPYPSALHGRGLALEKLLLVHTKERAESLWACEQVVRGMTGGAMLAWPDGLSFSEVRRLQLAAERTQKTVFLFHDAKAANASSPAALRLQLTADDGDLQIRVLKCRGQRPASNIRIRRSQLLQASLPSAVKSNEPGKNPNTPPEDTVLSLTASRVDRAAL